VTQARKGQRLELSVIIGELPAILMAAATETELLEQLGLAVQVLTDEVAQQLDYEGTEGVLIARVAPGSPAAMAGLQRRMLIREVNRQSVDDTAELREALARLEETRRVLLLVQDQQSTHFLALPLG
jgi:serine protease Do